MAPVAARPGTYVAAAAPAAVPVYSYGPQVSAYGYAPQGWYPPNPPYNYPAPSTNLTSILSGFGDIGTLSAIIAQVFAAVMPLPAAPTPAAGVDSDPSQNASTNSSNLILYQEALAEHAKRDQQVLTIGSVLKELLKRPNGMI